MFFWCLQPSHVAGRNCTVSSGETGTSLPSAVGSLGKDGFNGLGRGGIRRSQALREGIRPRGGIPAKQQQSSAEEWVFCHILPLKFVKPKQKHGFQFSGANHSKTKSGIVYRFSQCW